MEKRCKYLIVESEVLDIEKIENSQKWWEKQENEIKIEEKQFMILDMQSLCILFQTHTTENRKHFLLDFHTKKVKDGVSQVTKLCRTDHISVGSEHYAHSINERKDLQNCEPL